MKRGYWRFDWNIVFTFFKIVEAILGWFKIIFVVGLSRIFTAKRRHFFKIKLNQDMRNLSVVAVLMLFSLSGLSQKKAFDEPFRPQFHFTLDENRLGNPVALFQLDSVFQFLYQQNEHNLIDGYYGWGRATSSDLVYWKQEPMLQMGSTVVPDSLENSMSWGSVMHSDGKVSAVFLRNKAGVFQTETDDFQTWTSAQKFSAVTDGAQLEPYLFWHKSSGKWVLLAYDRERSMMQIFNSKDKISWEKSSEFSFRFGLPSMIEMPVDGREDDTRWVMFGESGVYMICKFDGQELKPDGPLSQFDHGKSVRGTVLFNDGKRIVLMSGLSAAGYADLPTAGTMSFPSEVSLTKLPEGIVLYRKPISELEFLQGKKISITDKKVYPGLKNNPLSKLKGREFRIVATIDAHSCDEMSFLIRSNKKQSGSLVSYDAKRKFFNVMGNSVPYQPVDKKIHIEILVDRSTIEVYLDNGRYVFSSSFNPLPESVYYELIPVGGEIIIEQLEAYSIRSIYNLK
jgi:fructan beta-fructosidase